MCKKSFRRCIENSLMCNVFQQLITSFCVVRKKHTLQCHCQLRSSTTSENCYEHFFFLLLILYKDTKVHLAKVAKQFKVTQSCRSISMAWLCCLVGLFGIFLQNSHLCCAPKKLLSGKILCEHFLICFMCFAFLELCLLSSLVCWTRLLHAS